MPAIFVQKINGHVWNFSSVSLVVNTPAPVFISQISEINYEYGVEVGTLRGTGAQKLGTTRGDFDANGSITLYEEEWRKMRTALAAVPFPVGGGYLEKKFTVTVRMGELAEVGTQHVLTGARILRVRRGLSQGVEPNMVGLDLDIMTVMEDGQSPVRDKSGIF